MRPILSNAFGVPLDNTALTITGLTKRYRDFTLDNVSFNVPYGAVVGFVGENGAGKSTTLKAVLGLIEKDAGTISILGTQEQDIDFVIRNKVGVVFDGNNLPERMTPKQLSDFLTNIFISWDKDKYLSMLDELSLPTNRKIKTFSKGMKMKLAIVAALSQNPELLIMDEPTSGLDPVVRDDILNMILDYVQEDKHSVLISSHITSDLEKIADYIVFIHKGKVIFDKNKDDLIRHYGMIKCDTEQFEAIGKENVISYRKQGNKLEILISDRNAMQMKYPNIPVVPATIDDIMLFYIKGEISCEI